MRITFVNSMRSVGGGETWLLEAMRGLTERGHEVAMVLRQGGAFADRAEREGHSVLRLPMSSDFDPASVFRLASFLRRFRPDVVNVSVQRAVRVGCAAVRLAGVGEVVERRGLNFPARPSRLNHWVYGRCVSFVLANCGEIADQMVDSGLVPEDRVAIVPNGIDPSRVPPGGGPAIRAELGLGQEAPLVSIVARLVRDKGHALAFEAFSRLTERLPGAKLAVVGSGRLGPELSELASSVAPAGSVIFMGLRDDVPAILDASDVLLVSSLREGMPHSILEAMVAGTPVVATEVAGIPEMIRDGREGLLIPAGSTEAIERALHRVLSDRDLARRLSEAAAQRVRAEFGLDVMIDRTERIFKAVAARAGMHPE